MTYDGDFHADVHCESVLYGISNLVYGRYQCEDFEALIRAHLQEAQDGDFLRSCLTEDTTADQFWVATAQRLRALLCDSEKIQALAEYGRACCHNEITDEIYDAAWTAVWETL
jgi:hypothetical protein